MEAATKRVYLDNPDLPDTIQTMDIRNLKVGSGIVDIHLTRHEHNVAVNVRDRTGKIEVVVIH